MVHRTDSDLMTNALGTVHLLQACREQSVQQVIYSSSSAIFGETIVVPVAEDHSQHPMSPYGLSKMTAEHYCLILGEEYGLKVCCLRYFNVYGVNQRYNPYGNVIPIFIERATQGKSLTIYGDGNQTRDFIEVRDIVGANLLAYEKGAQGVFNIGTGVATTVNELARQVLQAVQGEVSITYSDPRSGEVLHSVADISKAQRELGFSPAISVADGVSAYLAWFSSENAAETPRSSG